MGLDMACFRRSKVEGKEDIEVCTWRKFNALHNCIAEAAGKPDTNLEEIPLTKDMVQMIINECVKIIDILGSAEHVFYERDGQVIDVGEYTFKPEIISMIERSKLCPRPGFFWGSTDVDWWYERQIKETLDKMLKISELLDQGEEVYYWSWW